MNYRLVTKESFTVIGFDAKGSHRNPEDKELIGSLWESISKRRHELEYPHNPEIVTGICIPPASNDYYYIAGIEVNDDAEVPPGMSRHSFPENHYMVFTHKGPVTRLFDTYARIWGEWFPASGYKMVDGPELEIVDYGICSDPFSEQYEMDIYIPIYK
jgi:AraC family transcriptional regulator